MPTRFVLTGAPGSGKTTIAAVLRARGYVVVPEAATDVIAAEHERGGSGEPHQRPDFTNRIVALQRKRELAAGDGRGVQFYDRSPLCTLALARYLGHPVSARLAAEVRRVVDGGVFERDVFLVRPLGFITPTAARLISYEDALRFEAVHERTYLEHGYRLVEIGPGAAEVRAAAIEAHVRSVLGTAVDRHRKACDGERSRHDELGGT